MRVLNQYFRTKNWTSMYLINYNQRLVACPTSIKQIIASWDYFVNCFVEIAINHKGKIVYNSFRIRATRVGYN